MAIPLQPTSNEIREAFNNQNSCSNENVIELCDEFSYWENGKCSKTGKIICDSDTPECDASYCQTQNGIFYQEHICALGNPCGEFESFVIGVDGAMCVSCHQNTPSVCNEANCNALDGFNFDHGHCQRCSESEPWGCNEVHCNALDGYNFNHGYCEECSESEPWGCTEANCNALDRHNFFNGDCQPCSESFPSKCTEANCNALDGFNYHEIHESCMPCTSDNYFGCNTQDSCINITGTNNTIFTPHECYSNATKSRCIDNEAGYNYRKGGYCAHCDESSPSNCNEVNCDFDGYNFNDGYCVECSQSDTFYCNEENCNALDGYNFLNGYCDPCSEDNPLYCNEANCIFDGYNFFYNFCQRCSESEPWGCNEANCNEMDGYTFNDGYCQECSQNNPWGCNEDECIFENVSGNWNSLGGYCEPCSQNNPWGCTEEHCATMDAVNYFYGKCHKCSQTYYKTCTPQNCLTLGGIFTGSPNRPTHERAFLDNRNTIYFSRCYLCSERDYDFCNETECNNLGNLYTYKDGRCQRCSPTAEADSCTFEMQCNALHGYNLLNGYCQPCNKNDPDGCNEEKCNALDGFNFNHGYCQRCSESDPDGCTEANCNILNKTFNDDVCS